MKKLVKWFMIAAVLMVVIGMGLFIGGIMSVGGVAAAQAALGGYQFYIDEDGLNIGLENGKYDFTHHGAGTETTFDTKEVRSLDMEIGAAQVEIVANDSAKEISIDTDGRYDIYVKDCVLHVEAKRNLDDHRMRLEIPANAVFESVEISAGACELNIQYIETKEFDVEVGAGQVKIEDLTADEAEFEIGAGEAIVDYGNVQKCNVNVGMGNFEYNGVISKHGDIKCGMGNAELYLKGSEEDYNYEIDCAAGNVTIGDESFGGLGANQIINHHADADMDIECSMGNVTVGF